MIARCALVLVAAMLVSAVAPDPASARRKKPRLGVFGTINGKAFKATNLRNPDDPCVNGIYRPADGGITFAALECRGKRRRQGVAAKKNYKIVVMACANFDQSRDPSILPLEITCLASVYSEVKTGRFGIPLSQTQWGSSIEFTNPTSPTSSVRMRIDAVDGATVRGAFYGVFDQPIEGDASSTPAPISGEVQFDFPFRVQ